MDIAQPKVIQITLQDYKNTMMRPENNQEGIQVRFNGYSKMGYGNKRVECCDCYCLADGIELFGVFDGHGLKGKDFSQKANDNIQIFAETYTKKWRQFKSLVDAQRIFTEVFNYAEAKLEGKLKKYEQSGTCALVLTHFKNHCYIANLGHSKAVLYRKVNDQLMGIELTQDHRPSRKDESDRIQAKGGIIQGKLVDGIPTGEPRVYIPELKHEMKVTRSFGDFEAKKIGVIHEPEITDIEFSKEDQFIVLATDGLWDVMSIVEVGEFILKNKDNYNVCEPVIDQARTKWEERNKELAVDYLKRQQLGNYYVDDIALVVGMF